nr:MAG TPA: hypothetical protein [Bacteriophage sp.]
MPRGMHKQYGTTTTNSSINTSQWRYPWRW